MVEVGRRGRVVVIAFGSDSSTDIQLGGAGGGGKATKKLGGGGGGGGVGGEGGKPLGDTVEASGKGHNSKFHVLCTIGYSLFHDMSCEGLLWRQYRLTSQGNLPKNIQQNITKYWKNNSVP